MTLGANRVEPAADQGAAPTLAQWEARLRACLDPVGERADGAPLGGSDHDLNPELDPPLDGLQPAAVLILLVNRSQGPAVLLTRRADHMRRHAGKIAFPGGRSEPGETPWDTALRETCEEVGLAPQAIRLIGLSTPYRTFTGYHIRPVVGVLDAPVALALNPTEVAEAFEVPFAFLMDPANHAVRFRDQPPGPPRRHYAISWSPWLIWGATAGMLRALHQRLADVG